MISWLKIFLLLNFFLFANASIAIAAECSSSEKKLIELMDAGSEELGLLTHTGPWKDIISNPTPENFERAVRIVQKANRHLDNPGAKYESLFSYISKFGDDISTRDYLRGLLAKCLEKYLKNCQKGFHQISEMKKRSQLSVRLRDYDIGETGELKVPSITDSRGRQVIPDEVQMNFGSLDLEEFKRRAALLTDNLSEAGNIKVREGIGAVRYMQRNPDKVLKNYEHPPGSSIKKKIDFEDQMVPHINSKVRFLVMI